MTCVFLRLHLVYSTWNQHVQEPAGSCQRQKSATKGPNRMRRRRQYRDFDRPSGIVQLGRMFLAALILLVIGAGGLAYYGSTLQPPRHKVEKVLSDDRFPR